MKSNDRSNIYFNVFCFDRLTIKQSQFTEPSTNIQYVYVTDHDDYRLYKLIPTYDLTQAQIFTTNKLLEKYLQESFETPERSYPNVLQYCGTTMMAFFVQNSTLSLSNINALVLGRLEAYDNSKYICYLSTLKEHRQKGLGTKLLNEFINEAIRANHSRVSLHVNTENTGAMSLYLKCGMRCIQFIPGYYFGDRTYATQNAFIMTLQLKNVKNSTTVCQSTTAIEIPQQEDAFYRQTCPQAFTG
jgi:ribosomal protein S18 acetylase RimI-like enzyme